MEYRFFIVVALFVVLSAGSALRESLVYDEIFYLQEGVANLTARVFSDPYNPPLVRELTAIPLIITPSILPQSDIAAIRYLPARLVPVALGILLLCSVYLFAKRRTGSMTAFIAVLILALEPTVLAHSHYVTNDIGVTFFSFGVLGLACHAPYINMDACGVPRSCCGTCLRIKNICDTVCSGQRCGSIIL